MLRGYEDRLGFSRILLDFSRVLLDFSRVLLGFSRGPLRRRALVPCRSGGVIEACEQALATVVPLRRA